MADIRCETRACPESATHLVSRIDASRDYWYACEPHAYEHTRWSASEASPLPPRLEHRPAGRTWLTLETVLAMWPPKHRTSARRDAQRILEAAR